MDPLSPDAAEMLAEASVLRIVDAGPVGADACGIELHFVYDDGLILLLASAPEQQPPRWYQALHTTGRALIAIAGLRLSVQVETSEEHDLDLDEILPLFRDKYGMQLIKVWYEAAPCLSLVLRPLTVQATGQDS